MKICVLKGCTRYLTCMSIMHLTNTFPRSTNADQLKVFGRRYLNSKTCIQDPNWVNSGRTQSRCPGPDHRCAEDWISGTRITLALHQQWKIEERRSPYLKVATWLEPIGVESSTKSPSAPLEDDTKSTDICAFDDDLFAYASPT